jgi:hypothetical protein
MAMAPKDLILRCYGYKDKFGKWYGVCLDLNLAAEAESLSELRSKLNNMIESYIAVALNTNDNTSVPDLLSRKAPLFDWLCYYMICSLNYVRQIPDRITFNEIIPFRLAHNNC